MAAITGCPQLGCLASHAWDPQWEQHVIVGNGPPAHSDHSWIHWKQSDERWQVSVIDTTNMDVEQMLDRVALWVKSERKKELLFTPDTRWWEGKETQL